MAFPSTPTNGQIAVVGGIAYQYATTTNSWGRIVSTANVITANVITVDTLTANTLNVNNNLYNIAGNISATGNINIAGQRAATVSDATALAIALG